MHSCYHFSQPRAASLSSESTCSRGDPAPDSALSSPHTSSQLDIAMTITFFFLSKKEAHELLTLHKLNRQTHLDLWTEDADS